MKEIINIQGERSVNTNEMISDYLFSRQIILEHKPLDFEQVVCMYLNI